jgi:phosphatidylinositol dimannoside acyltransferase
VTDTELDTPRSPSERADEPAPSRPGLDTVRQTARAAIEKPTTDPGTVVQRVRAAALSAVSWAACRLPEGPQIALAELVGRTAYRASPARTARVRANLRRVVEYLATSDMANDLTRAAAADPRALERLVRAAFRHRARYYLEILRAPGLDARIFDERLAVENIDVVDAALAGDKSAIFISGHLGPIELPGLYLAQHSGRRITAPMETLGDPALQRWFERTRATFGVRIVGLREARRELLKELRNGESVGLVADRDITGGGMEVPFFGAPAPLPVGPAFLATETDVPLYLASVWRVGKRGYRGRLDEIPVTREGARRDRIGGTLAAEARGFERVIANAPEQWMAIFFPVWPDLEAQLTANGAAQDAVR